MKDVRNVYGALSFASLILLTMTSFLSCGGSRWSLVSTEPHAHSLEFLSLVFADSNHGWAITPLQLLETSDGGKTWIERFVREDKTFYSMEFSTRLTGFIGGGETKAGYREPFILRTDDSGKTWRETALDLPAADGNRAIYSISFCSPQIGWAVGSGVVLRTTNSGQSWEVQRTNNGEMLLGVSCVSIEQAWVVGENGLILQTGDGGKSWSRQASGTTDNLARVRFFDSEGWIVGGVAGSNVLLQTHDSGASWQRRELNSAEPLFDIYINGRQGWIVGAAGTIFESSDGGQTWRRQETPTSNDLTCLFFLSPRRGWAAGDKRTVLLFSE